MCFQTLIPPRQSWTDDPFLKPIKVVNPGVYVDEVWRWYQLLANFAFRINGVWYEGNDVYTAEELGIAWS
ncbi:xkdP-like LysM domain-containing protein [Salmonella phage 19]|nr:xkdP-like LysM domain-containing protein [Salmonella phage 19]